jgi:hypothetical protein
LLSDALLPFVELSYQMRLRLLLDTFPEVWLTCRVALIVKEETLLAHLMIDVPDQHAEIEPHAIMQFQNLCLVLVTIHLDLLFSATGFSPVSQYQAGCSYSVRRKIWKKKSGDDPAYHGGDSEGGDWVFCLGIVCPLEFLFNGGVFDCVGMLYTG